MVYSEYLDIMKELFRPIPIAPEELHICRIMYPAWFPALHAPPVVRTTWVLQRNMDRLKKS